MTDTPEDYRRRLHYKASDYGRPLYRALSGDSNACDDAYDRGWDVGRAAGWNAKAVARWRDNAIVAVLFGLLGFVIGASF